MILFAYSSLLAAGLTGFLALLWVPNQRLTALTWGALAVVTGRWSDPAGRRLRRRQPRRVSFRQAAAAGHPPGTSHWRRRRAKFLLRGWLRRRDTSGWLERLAEPDAKSLWTIRPRLGSKLQRPYVNRRWGARARLEALIAHYDTLSEHIAGSVRESIYRDGITLLRIAALGTPALGAEDPANWALEAKLAYRDQFEKEGELTLLVEDPATGLALAGLTFCICGGRGAREFWIGGLQASPDPRVRGLIRDATKHLHGMRPKALAVWLLQELARDWGIGRIRAVSDQVHIYRHWHKRRQIAATYDEFWTECCGAPIAEGGWELPLAMPVRPREELKPSRRRAHELRYAMLAEFKALVSARCRALDQGVS